MSVSDRRTADLLASRPHITTDDTLVRTAPEPAICAWSLKPPVPARDSAGGANSRRCSHFRARLDGISLLALTGKLKAQVSGPARRLRVARLQAGPGPLASRSSGIGGGAQALTDMSRSTLSKLSLQPFW